MFSRRSAIAGICTLAGLALPSAVVARAAPPKSWRLRPGDTVGLIASAMFSDDLFEVEQIKSTIAAMGLVPRVGRHVTARYGYLAGTDRQRAQDVNDMYADKDVRAVFAVHGGWGSARLLPFLDWNMIRANPKLLIGFSDITALHLAFAARAGFPTIHGPNAANRWEEASWNSFWKLAFAAETPLFRNPETQGLDPLLQERWRTSTIRPGKAVGTLIGGNLSVLASLVGTPWLPDFEKKILFLEDSGEAEYRIDRMMTQLGQAGILGKVAGIVFGQCTRCAIGIPDYSGFTVPQLLHQHLAPLGVPVFHGANIGHVSNQLSLPVGVRAEIDAEAGTIRILEPAVA
ncbi:S66 peptidase family protein [Sphingosinicella rhizophila]|uniref:LD-carboxypeptidase n=1 Tax=Sphingosinicella rhizophila TaxID=3050082 RepID=A0ABU3QAU1_9SPHN|nr:LD-carboxypeptidase [Sphingosinicella sp. GR2756]MDT9600525.1 LD-carboxypeptidase [Sphingosinicella sp. GR2756]